MPMSLRRRPAVDGANGRSLSGVGFDSSDQPHMPRGRGARWMSSKLHALRPPARWATRSPTTPAAKMQCNDEAAASMEQTLRRRRPLHRRPSQISETLHSKRTLAPASWTGARATTRLN